MGTRARRTDWDAVAFVRTRGWESRDPGSDAVPDFPSLLRWAATRDLVSGIELAVLARRAAEHPEEAADVVRRCHGVRDVIYGVLRPVAERKDPPAAALEQLNRAWRSVALQRRLQPTERGYAWGWREVTVDDAPLDRVVWPVIASAMNLLTAPEVSRLKVCAADDCGWLFIDDSRNASRRWCDMKECGNRAKVRRFRARKKGRA